MIGISLTSRDTCSTVHSKMAFNPGSVSCYLCGEPFSVNENMVNSGGQVWHQKCFV